MSRLPLVLHRASTSTATCRRRGRRLLPGLRRRHRGASDRRQRGVHLTARDDGFDVTTTRDQWRAANVDRHRLVRPAGHSGDSCQLDPPSPRSHRRPTATRAPCPTAGCWSSAPPPPASSSPTSSPGRASRRRAPSATPAYPAATGAWTSSGGWSASAASTAPSTSSPTTRLPATNPPPARRPPRLPQPRPRHPPALASSSPAGSPASTATSPTSPPTSPAPPSRRSPASSPQHDRRPHRRHRPQRRGPRPRTLISLRGRHPTRAPRPGRPRNHLGHLGHRPPPHLPMAADPGPRRAGEIRQRRGVTAIPGLYVLGQRFQHTRRSNFIDGVGADAAFVADHLIGRTTPITRR